MNILDLRHTVSLNAYATVKPKFTLQTVSMYCNPITQLLRLLTAKQTLFMMYYGLFMVTLVLQRSISGNLRKIIVYQNGDAHSDMFGVK